MSKIAKPKSLSVLGIIIFVIGIILAAFSVLFIAIPDTLFSFFESFKINKPSFQTWSLTFILLVFESLFHIVMGIVILRGINWGRMWYLWLSLTAIAISALQLHYLYLVLRCLVFLIFLYFLTRPRISFYCGKVKVPVKYTTRSLFTRPLTTILTIFGISLVSFMFCAVLMLADGIKAVLVSTGEEGNVMILQEGRFNEIMSALVPEQVDMLENIDGFQYSPELGTQLLTPELAVSITLLAKNSDKEKNVAMRGATEISPHLRSNFKLIEGEFYQLGLPTCIVGTKVKEKFKNCNIGDSIKVVNDYFQIVGVFRTGSMYDSEIWADKFTLIDSYNRAGLAGTTVLARLEKGFTVDSLRAAIEAMPDLELNVFDEQKYYARQAENTTFFIKALGIFICVVFALGATIGAMITMYSAVSNRTSEIATMRALGFQPEGIQAAFLMESMAIGILGAVIGIAAASILSTFELQMFSTINFFGEFYLKMTLTLFTVLYTFFFAISMGFIGGVFPSIRASRMKIVEAFR